MRALAFLVSTFALLNPLAAYGAESVFVAVASNFHETLRELEPLFEEQTGYSMTISVGSTGLLYAQIRQGAPFDVLLAADRKIPAALVASGLASASNVATYAEGQLVLVSHSCPNGLAQLPIKGTPVRIAIANPRVAPYGQAARSVLAQLHRGDMPPDIAQASNVAAAYSMFRSGAVDAALVAGSLLVDAPMGPCRAQPIPQPWHQPLDQDMSLLKRAENNPAAQAFFDFMLSVGSQRVIARRGYGVSSQ